MSDKNLQIDPRKLTPEQEIQLQQHQQNLTSAKQLLALKDSADMLQELIFWLDGFDKDREKSSKEVGAVLVDIRENLVALKDKKDPEERDHAAPVVKQLEKLETALSKIDVKPQVNVSSPDVKVPPLDLKQIEKILKTDLPKAFKEAIKLVPKTNVPKADFKPILTALEGLSEQLTSIDTATRMKPLPGSMKVTNPDGSNIGGGLTDTELRATAVPTIESRPSAATLANVTMTGSSVTVQASDISRRNWTIYNDSGVVVYLKLGSTASATSFTVKLVDQAYYELPSPVYTGIITALGASGVVRVTST